MAMVAPKRGRFDGQTMIKPWPKEELEAVLQCPVCRSPQRKLLHGGLVDQAFRVADGSWDLYRCTRCACAYLDPRPTPSGIGRAYTRYYTHDPASQPQIANGDNLRSFMHALIRGYMNHRYGLSRRPALSLGRWLVPLVPPLRAFAAMRYRHLPPQPVGGGRVLDVGCGNGGFLAVAREAGWEVEGVDFDIEAVNAARSLGLNVRHGGIELFLDKCACYDVITLSHVIEHVHDPVALVQRLYELLKPGGMLWLETPNIDSLGSRRFGRNWRGLEPPRHLVMFTTKALVGCLRAAGFRDVRRLWRGVSVFEVFSASEAIEKKEHIDAPDRRKPLRLAHLLAEVWEMSLSSRREFITCLAIK